MGFSKIYFILTTVLLEERDEKLPSEDLVSEGRTGEEETQVSNEDSVRVMFIIFISVRKISYLTMQRE